MPKSETPAKIDEKVFEDPESVFMSPEELAEASAALEDVSPVEDAPPSEPPSDPPESAEAEVILEPADEGLPDDLTPLEPGAKEAPVTEDTPPEPETAMDYQAMWEEERRKNERMEAGFRRDITGLRQDKRDLLAKIGPPAEAKEPEKEEAKPPGGMRIDIATDPNTGEQELIVPEDEVERHFQARKPKSDPEAEATREAERVEQMIREEVMRGVPQDLSQASTDALNELGNIHSHVVNVVKVISDDNPGKVTAQYDSVMYALEKTGAFAKLQEIYPDVPIGDVVHMSLNRSPRQAREIHRKFMDTRLGRIAPAANAPTTKNTAPTAIPEDKPGRMSSVGSASTPDEDKEKLLRDLESKIEEDFGSVTPEDMATYTKLVDERQSALTEARQGRT